MFGLILKKVAYQNRIFTLIFFSNLRYLLQYVLPWNTKGLVIFHRKYYWLRNFSERLIIFATKCNLTQHSFVSLGDAPYSSRFHCLRFCFCSLPVSFVIWAASFVILFLFFRGVVSLFKREGQGFARITALPMCGRILVVSQG